MKRMQGFTLIELVAVIVLLGILSISVALYFPSATSFDLTTATETLKRNIRYTQTLAMSLNTAYALNATASSYSIVKVSPSSQVLSVTLPSGVSLSAFTPTSLSFDADGKPSSSASYTVTGGGASQDITVAAETGYVP